MGKKIALVAQRECTVSEFICHHQLTEAELILREPSDVKEVIADNKPDVLIVLWSEPSPRLDEVIRLAQDGQQATVIVISQVNLHAFNSITDLSGCVLLPECIGELSGWLTYAQQVMEAYARLNSEISRLNGKLEERKYIEKAKGLLMKQHQLEEGEAFKALRSAAMQQSVPMGQVAKNLIALFEMKG